MKTWQVAFEETTWTVVGADAAQAAYQGSVARRRFRGLVGGFIGVKEVRS
jgi:hypothetical protein